MKTIKKIIISITFATMIILLGVSSASATESAWQNLTPSFESGLSGNVTNCSPLTVTNGSVAAYPACTITCNSGYDLSGSSCVVHSSSSSSSGSSFIPVALAATTKVGDANGDNIVNKYDFSLMMSDWGKTGTSTSDFNKDGKVDKYDFALLMSKWGM
jgi:hypothetical protein